MNRIVLFAVTLLCFFTLSAQEKKRFTINPGEKPSEKIPREEIYHFGEFTMAAISMKSGLATQARLNYNSLYGEMQFIDGKGDTLSIADENNIQLIAAGKDTFYFHEGWLELISNNTNSKLVKNKMLQISNKEKIGAMDIPAFGAIETNTKSTASQQTRDLVAKERLTYTAYNKYYFGDRFNHFFPATKKSLLKIYGKQQTVIEQYLRDNKIDFSADEDLKKLSVFLQGL